MRTYRLAAAAGTAALLALGALAPSYAAGGPPTITSLTPNPIASDGVVTVVGGGCDPASPVSFLLADTNGGGGADQLQFDAATTADGSGGFTHAIPLDNYFTAGNELAVVASCSPAFTWDAPFASNPLADDAYVQITVPNPEVDITIVSTAGYGSRPAVRVTTSDATGLLSVKLDGAQIYQSSTSSNAHNFRIAATTPLGAHSLQASFDPTDDVSPVANDTATFTIVKASSAVRLIRPGAKKVRAKKWIRFVVALASTGPRTGTVAVRDGRTIRKTVIVRAADNGRKVVWVKLPKKGLRALTARYAGNRLTKPSLSPKVFVRVKR